MSSSSSSSSSSRGSVSSSPPPSLMSSAATCVGCKQPILDQFVYNVLDRPWHAACIQCQDCGCGLSDKCYEREGKLLCKEDFFRRYGQKCAGCAAGIAPGDQVQRAARGKLFHLACFVCCACRRALGPAGEHYYVLGENRFLCKQDYMLGSSLKKQQRFNNLYQGI